MTNVALIRNYLKDPNLCIENFEVGSRTNKTVSIVYMNGIASEQYGWHTKKKNSKHKNRWNYR